MILTIKRDKFDVFEQASITEIGLNELVSIQMALDYYHGWLKEKGIYQAAEIADLLQKLTP